MKKINKKLLFFTASTFFILSLVVLHYDVGTILAAGASGTGFNNPIGDETTTVSGLLIEVIKWILGISAFLAMLALVVGGVRLIISFGNDQAVAAAKKNILWAVIGVSVIILSYAIITLVADLLGAGLPGDG